MAADLVGVGEAAWGKAGSISFSGSARSWRLAGFVLTRGNGGERYCTVRSEEYDRCLVSQGRNWNNGYSEDVQIGRKSEGDGGRLDVSSMRLDWVTCVCSSPLAA